MHKSIWAAMAQSAASAKRRRCVRITHESLPWSEKQLASFRRDFPGLDIPWLEREFRDWVAEREAPSDYAAAFYGFMKRKRDEA